MQRARIPIDDLGIFTMLASAMTMQPLGGDTLDRRVRSDVSRSEPGAEPRRGWLERLDHWFWKQEQAAREAYLAASTDIYDLEVRIRSLERGSPWL